MAESNAPEPKAEPQPQANPQQPLAPPVAPKKPVAKAEKEFGLKEYVIAIVGLMLLLWWTGILDDLSFSELSVSNPFEYQPTAPPKDNFRLITPLNPIGNNVALATGSFISEFANTGSDLATIEQITVQNFKGKKNCTVKNELPIKLESGGRFNLTATGCSVPGAKLRGQADIVVYIDLKTTKKARFLSQKSRMAGQGAQGLQQANRTQSVSNIPNPDEIVNERSFGTLTGLYL
ncbi:MAG: hypothetical protein NTU61_00075 [Candidatus Altiarchaeota archaeon]|nr:hypothetical protein [Candidatus Altiarchaeota archaeon]